ncbi:MAG: hypothetical protein ACRCVN_02030 [Spirochaetia bacterium]
MIRKNFDNIFKLKEKGLCFIKNMSLVRSYISADLKGYHLYKLGWQSEVMVVNRSLKNPQKSMHGYMKKPKNRGHC